MTAILTFDLVDLNLCPYRFYVPSLVCVRSLGAEIWLLPVLAAILNFDLVDLNLCS